VAGVDRWNKVIEKAGIPFRLKCRTRPSTATSAPWGVKVSPDGRVVSEPNGTPRSTSGCPAAEDRAYVASLMGRVVEPGKFANWIAPPVMGINRQPVDFEYVRFTELLF
jgi:benzoyl-CoA 2,3-dioxygenase component B